MNIGVINRKVTLANQNEPDNITIGNAETRIGCVHVATEIYIYNMNIGAGGI